MNSEMGTRNSEHTRIARCMKKAKDASRGGAETRSGQMCEGVARSIVNVAVFVPRSAFRVPSFSPLPFRRVS
jgi:hypothetical protein